MPLVGNSVVQNSHKKSATPVVTLFGSSLSTRKEYILYDYLLGINYSVKLGDVGSGQYYGRGPLWGPPAVAPPVTTFVEYTD